VLNVAVPLVVLEQRGVYTLLGEGTAAGMAQHVGMVAHLKDGRQTRSTTGFEVPDTPEQDRGRIGGRLGTFRRKPLQARHPAFRPSLRLRWQS
jgi:hypothetical protein